MPKLDLDAARKRHSLLGDTTGDDALSDIEREMLYKDLPTALAECEWSREMLEQAQDLAQRLRLMGTERDQRCAGAFLHALGKGPPDVA